MGRFEYPIGDVLNMSSPRQGPQALTAAPSILSELGKQSLDQDRYLKELALDVNHYLNKLDTVSTLQYDGDCRTGYVQQIIGIVSIEVSYIIADHADSPQPVGAQSMFPPAPTQPNHWPEPKTKLDAVIQLHVSVQTNMRVLEDLESGLAKITDMSTETIRCLRELKKQLLVYTTVLDKLLLSVTNIGNCFNHSDFPIDQVRECQESVLGLIEKFSPEELHKVISPEAVATPDHVLCSILGLSSSCAEHLHSIPDRIRNHEPDVYWINRLLEDNWTNTIVHADDETMTNNGAVSDFDFVSHMGLSESTSFPDSDYLSSGAVMTDVQNGTTKRSLGRIQSGDLPKKLKIDVIDLGLLAELEKMGFTPSRARLLCDRLSSNKYKDSQTTLYWAQLYIDAAFEYDILLNNAPRFPYQPDKVGVEITENLRVIDDDDDDMITTKPVRMINLNTSEDPHFTRIYNYFSKECRKNDENVLLFHASNHRSVQHILENGILTNGKNGQDFSDGNGFYSSYSMEFSTDWAKSGRFSPSAIIVYKVPKSTFENFTCLNLNDDKTIWEKVIRYYRSGRTRSICKCPRSEMREYDGYDRIDGPMCVDSPSVARSHSFCPKGFSRGLEYRSLCIKSESLAEEMGRFVDFVIFF